MKTRSSAEVFKKKGNRVGSEQNRIAIIGHQAFSMCNFRKSLIKELVSIGYFVYALAPDYDEEKKSVIASLGAVPIDYKLERTGTSPFKDLIGCLELGIILKKLDVDLTLGYSIKPVIYGSIVSKLCGNQHVYSMIEGLGHVFIEVTAKNRLKNSLLRIFVSFMYRLSLKCNDKVFFLNPDDANFFVSKKLVKKNKVVKIPGIGVNLKHFAFCLAIEDPVTFIFIGRLLKEKGIYEYISAVRCVKASHPMVKFTILGDTDSNPSSVKKEEINRWVSEGLVDWPGNVADVRPWIASSSVFVLPSYREGLPRSTQEAMAMGRAIITTDVPGCRETVEDGTNGFIIPARDSQALADAMLKFIIDPILITSMGLESRKQCQNKFNEENINLQILSSMGIYQ